MNEITISPQLRERSKMGTAANRLFILMCAIALSGFAWGQSSKTASPTPMFHVEGTFGDQQKALIPYVEVHFVSDNTDRSVIADDKGFYQTDLPVGTYTMTAAAPPSRTNQTFPFTKYDRFFRVASPITLTLNGTLYAKYFCDGVWVGEEAEEGYKDVCGGEDSFTFPSKDHVPFRLEIRYVRRTRKETFVSYSSTSVVQRPVFVAYNLFALQADSVDYNTTDGTIRAFGNVIFEDQSGKVRAGSAAFRFDDGRATRF